MNVDSIYQLQRDDAFADQFKAEEYLTFVAMPFSNRGGYPEQRIRDLLAKVHEQANSSRTGKIKPFAKLRRVDDVTSGTVSITDTIIRQILACHFYWGDLTGCNFGVVLETGLALALKPNERVLLYTQDGTHELHFDLKVTHITSYDEKNLVNALSNDLVRAAEFFEKEADTYIRSLSSKLTSDAIYILNAYGCLWKEPQAVEARPGMFLGQVVPMFNHFGEPGGGEVFNGAIRELLQRRLIWTNYQSNINGEGDAFAYHATKLGWLVIEHIWNHDEAMRKPSNAPTGPNLSNE